MIKSDKMGGTFVVSCDKCGKEEIFDTGGDWREMIAEAKTLGWRMRKQYEEWRHYCSDCASIR